MWKATFEKWEISRLHNMLDDEGIDHVYRNRFDGADEGIDWGYQIFISLCDGRILSVIQGAGTYGFRENLLESAIVHENGGVADVHGWLSAECVLERILSEIFDADERRGYTKITDEEWEALNVKNKQE